MHERLLETLKGSGKLFADATTAPVLDPGRGRTKTGPLWAYARDDRPWGGTDPPGVAYVYAPDRTAGRPIAHLRGFAGVLQVDGYAAYESLAKGGAVRLAYCWSHVRRQFYDLAAASPIATEALSRIAVLYRIETEIRGRSAEDRRAARQERSRPVVEALEPWLREKLGLLSRKSNLAEAIRYALSCWAGLSLYLDDGRVEIDSNTVERAIRPLALNRKNALFAGSDGGGKHWAVIASLVETCKLIGVEPQAYLADVITRIVDGHPQRRLDDLLPWAYQPISVQFAPNDREAVRAGMRAEVKFPALQTRRTSAIFGTLTMVSRDRLVDDGTKQAYFAGTVEIDDHQLPDDARPRLLAGLPAKVVVSAGERTALDYLAAPFFDALGRSFHDR